VPNKKRKIVAKRRPVVRRRKRKQKKTELVVYRQQQPVQLRDDQIDLIRRLCAKDANEDEFKLFMQIAKSSRLDPFKKEIYCLIFQTKHGRQQVIITGIGGYRAMAARDHKDYDGSSAGQFTWFDPKQYTPAGQEIPETCTMEIYAKGSSHPTVATVRWGEYAPKDLREPRADFWNRMPTNQLEKCCESKGVKKRFPGMSNIYVDAELDQRRQDYTPEGRQVSTGGVAPSGAIVDPYKAAKAAQQKVLEAKLDHAHPAGSAAAKNAEAALRRVEAEDARLAAAKNVTPKKPKEPKAPKPKKIPPGCTLLTGTIHNVVFGTAKGKDKKAPDGRVIPGKPVPFVKLQVNRDWFTIWSRTIQEHFTTGLRMVGNVIECWTKPVPDRLSKIEGLRRINDTYFQDDGRTPIPREPGADGD
jgi:phage recombination protein Bet